MAKAYELTAALRDRTGKGAARATRREGMVPGVIYGGGQAPMAIKLPYKDVDLRIHGGGFLTTIVTLAVDGKKIRAIPRDFQLDPVKDFPLHVDFLRIARGAHLTLEIPVHFINEEAAPGIKRGGVLNVVRHTVEVDCPADAIPEFFTADLTGMEINDSLHISAIDLPEGVTPTISDRDFTIATVAASAGIKEELRAEAEAEGEPEGDAAEGAEAAEESADAGEDEAK